MKVLVMGDSWGKSEIEYAFLRKKHTVFNKAIFGGNNHDSLIDSINFLSYSKDFIQIDIIIWFQTEYIRDLNVYNYLKLVDTTTGYYSTLDQIHEITYEKILKIKELSPKSKWVIIGGHAPIYKPESYSWANMLISDWRAELLGRELPFCHAISHGMLASFEKIFGLDVLEKEIEKYEVILDAVLKEPVLFPDGVHPSYICYEQLYDKIIKKLYFFAR